MGVAKNVQHIPFHFFCSGGTEGRGRNKKNTKIVWLA